jgi:hypothetical protein
VQWAEESCGTLHAQVYRAVTACGRGTRDRGAEPHRYLLRILSCISKKSLVVNNANLSELDLPESI